MVTSVPMAAVDDDNNRKLKIRAAAPETSSSLCACLALVLAVRVGHKLYPGIVLGECQSYFIPGMQSE